MAGNSSLSGSLVSQRSARYVKKRRAVGDRVAIASQSGVYLNKSPSAVVEEQRGGKTVKDSDEGCEHKKKDFEMVSDAIRNSKDLPKVKNTIFEESLESQEVSFYIDDYYSDPNGHTNEYDSFDSFDDDSETEADVTYDNVELRRNIHDVPLPEPPPDSNGLAKFAKNVNKIKKNLSRDLSKSLRRISRKIRQEELKEANVPNVQAHVETAAPITRVSIEDQKLAMKPKEEDAQKPSSLLTRIRRSMSISAEAAMLFSSKFDSQRRSTFYLTDPIDVDTGQVTHEGNNDDFVVASKPDVQPKPKLIRPKSPPPPAPIQNGKSKSSRENRAKSLYAEAGLFLNNNLTTHTTNNFQNEQNQNNHWYRESGLYSKEESKTENKRKSYASVIDELSAKLNTTSNSIINTNPPNSNFRNSNNYNGEESGGNNLNEDTNNRLAHWKDSITAELNSRLGSVGTVNNFGNEDNNSSRNSSSNSAETESPYNSQSVKSFTSTSSKTDESSFYLDNELQFLQDEPLYQFYDAALLKSICGSTEDEDDSEFEADIYEDVEQTNEDYISSSELEFSSSNNVLTRSLWCEIPEVKKSTVLSQLSTQQKKLQEAKFEVITSEASYLNSMNVLVNHFLYKFKRCNIVNEQEVDKLFGKIKEVRNCSKKILSDLEKCWKKNILLDGICDVIQKHAQENFDVYIPYCENQVALNDTLNQMKERPGFTDFLSEVESSSSCQFLSLYSFLMLPMQRITRWPLLVDAILKRLSESDPEYLTCQHALTSLNKIVSQCNEAARNKEREMEVLKISKSLEFTNGVPYINVISPDRWLLKSGTVTQLQPRSDDGKMTFGKRFNKIQLNLFVFNNLFVVTKKKSENTFTVLYYCSKNFIELRTVDTLPLGWKKDIQDKNVIYLSILENQDGKTVELLLSTSTETDKERWIEAFSPPLSEDPDETLYERWDCPQVTVQHNYTARQPDELSLSRGDVINVLRKMSDGWYHGERLRDGETGWFPANHTVEILNRHVRARNLKQRYRLLMFSEHYLKT